MFVPGALQLADTTLAAEGRKPPHVGQVHLDSSAVPVDGPGAARQQPAHVAQRAVQESSTCVRSTRGALRTEGRRRWLWQCVGAREEHFLARLELSTVTEHLCNCLPHGWPHRPACAGCKDSTGFAPPAARVTGVAGAAGARPASPARNPGPMPPAAPAHPATGACRNSLWSNSWGKPGAGPSQVCRQQDGAPAFRRRATACGADAQACRRRWRRSRVGAVRHGAHGATRWLPNAGLACWTAVLRNDAWHPQKLLAVHLQTLLVAEDTGHGDASWNGWLWRVVKLHHEGCRHWDTTPEDNGMVSERLDLLPK